MMKRMMMIVLAMMLLVSGAQAQSIFDTTQTAAVNFGQIVGVTPASVKTNAFTGQITEVYENVDDYMFNQFGEALGEKSYLVINGEERPDGMYYEVGKGDVASMYILYNRQTGRLEISYGPASGAEKQDSAPATRELPDIFEDCKQIEYGETVKISGFGRFTIKTLVLDAQTDYLYSDMFIGTTTLPGSMLKARAYVVANFENTGTAARKMNAIMKCTLYYITDENVYSYKSWAAGGYQKKGIYIGTRDRGGSMSFDLSDPGPFTGYKQSSVGSLDSEDIAVVFDSMQIPDAVHKAKDGMLAVVIECAGEKYVVVDRWE